MQDIFIVIGVSEDALILNCPISLEGRINSTLECWDSEGHLFLCTPKDVAGNIVEVDAVLSTNSDLKEIPIGSFVCFSGENVLWYVTRYYEGVYNKMIENLMEACGITDYKLPSKKLSKLY